MNDSGNTQVIMKYPITSRREHFLPVYISGSANGGSPVMPFPTHRNVTLRTSEMVHE